MGVGQVGLDTGYEGGTSWVPERMQHSDGTALLPGYASNPAGHKNPPRWQMHPAPGPPPPTPPPDNTLLLSLQPAGADVFTDAFVQRLETARRRLMAVLATAMESEGSGTTGHGQPVPWEPLVAELGASAACAVPGYSGSTTTQAGARRWRRSGNQPEMTAASFGPAALAASGLGMSCRGRHTVSFCHPLSL